MCKFNPKNDSRRIDPCMKNLIKVLPGTFACCCGHGKYHMSIILKNINGDFYEVFSGKIIPRKKRFYKKDKEGYYYIPEIEDHPKKKLSPIESRILTILIQNEDHITTSQVAKATKISWNTALRHLKKFYDLGWIDKFESGSTIYWIAVG